MVVDGHKIAVSNPDKVLFPRSGITKGELVDYYARIWPYIAPLLQGRPVSLQRYPDGITHEGFFQKETPEYFPSYIDRVAVKHSGVDTLYSVINNKAGLIYIANMASIPIHTWQSRESSLRYPDQVIWDLDPSDDDFEKVRMGARLLRYMLQEMGLEPLVKVTGSKGVHLTVPIRPEYTYTEVKAFSLQVAAFVSQNLPELFTTELPKHKRLGRIFVDYLRNQYGHTAVAPFSVRALEGAPVAVPVTWDELEEPEVHPQFVTIRNIDTRLKEKGYLWANFYDHAQSLTKPMQKLTRLLKRKKSSAKAHASKSK